MKQSFIKLVFITAIVAFSLQGVAQSAQSLQTENYASVDSSEILVHQFIARNSIGNDTVCAEKHHKGSPCTHHLHASKKYPPRPKIALVLGGGGAKGAAEVGVLKYIEKAGIPIDIIVGTSIGSIVGGLYSVGYRSQHMDSLFRSQEWLSLLTDRSTSNSDKLITRENGTTFFLGFPLPSITKKIKEKSGFHLGTLRGDSIVSLFNRMTGLTQHVNFDLLPIPFRCVAVDVNTFEEVILKEGILAEAMRASMAIPLAFKPMIIDGRTLVDGGVMNNLPVDVARNMGADIVIAIDLVVDQHEKDENYEDKDFSIWGRMELLNLMKWKIERPDLKKYRHNWKNADVYINPNLSGFDAADFKTEKIAEMITRGEEEGKSIMPQLEALMKKLTEEYGYYIE